MVKGNVSITELEKPGHFELPLKTLIGIFDSGVGGLSVLQAIQDELPDESIIYLADQAHVPYGSRPLVEVQRYSHEITRFLIQEGAKIIVVACHAASAAALHSLRQTFVDDLFVGMEPAIKPAVEGTHTGVVGVLATPATFQGELYASVVERFAHDVRVLQHTCPGLVSQIEKGDLDSLSTRKILIEAIQPMLDQGIDSIVLGCTHYPFVIPLITEIVGPAVRVINPAPAVARQVSRILRTTRLSSEREIRDMPGSTNPDPATTRFYTTGNPTIFANLLPKLIGQTGNVQKISF